MRFVIGLLFGIGMKEHESIQRLYEQVVVRQATTKITADPERPLFSEDNPLAGGGLCAKVQLKQLEASVCSNLH